MIMTTGDVIQFNENHKWCGCLGIIGEVKHYTFPANTRYQIYVEIPQQGRAYIYVMENENAIEYIGKSKLVLQSEEGE